ncbi:hypothetical protein CBS147353_10899 [Aspergillus niger]|nr:hypothetical protein CBS147353_10899 [Aspergillus niger]
MKSFSGAVWTGPLPYRAPTRAGLGKLSYPLVWMGWKIDDLFGAGAPGPTPWRKARNRIKIYERREASTSKVNPGYLSFLSSFLPPLPSPCLADGIWYWSCPVLLTTVLSVPLTRSQASGHLAFMS